jgi:hypothetical protein
MPALVASASWNHDRSRLVLIPFSCFHERMLQPKTLREFYEQGNSLLVVCGGGGRVYLAPEDPLRCRHTALIELPTIIQHLGWDFDFDKGRYELQSALVCEQCGRRSRTFSCS